jgi:Flp pilus assembly protein TadB
MKNPLIAILHYLKDWKNILAHSLIGILILVVAFFLPVPLYIRIVILVLVVVFNIARMNFKRKKHGKK